MVQLDSEAQLKLEGKILSYYSHIYKSFVYLGCAAERKSASQNRVPFDPKRVRDCVDAMKRTMPLVELIPPLDEVIPNVENDTLLKEVAK